MTKLICFVLPAVLLLGALPANVGGARILGIFPHIGKSHFIMFEELMKALAARGHRVVVMSHFPQKTPIPGYTDISLDGSMNIPYGNSISMADHGQGNVANTVNLLLEITLLTCKNTFAFPAFQDFLKSNQKFDLIMYETFNTDCLLALVHKLKAPSIALSSSVYMPWTLTRFGMPDNPSYIGNHFLPHSDRMNFLERLKNTIYQEALKVLYWYFVDVPTHKMAVEHFGADLPPFSEIAKNTSMLLINTHHSVHQVRPLVPAVVEVAGLHIKPPKKLPQDLDKFLTEAKHGVIFVSFGSTVRTASVDPDKLKAILTAFAELPQKILWKWEDDNMPGKPANVLIRKWLPQNDVLAHKNVKVFWTHGGLMGTLEAIYNGVPMVSMPLFGDQDNNVQNCVEKGIAVKLRYPDITKETVVKALRTVIDDSKYMENMKKASRIYHDRPRLPLDEAIFWSEYVIRHGGAPHLRSAAVHLPLYQYLLLDVIAVLCLAMVILIVVPIFLVKVLLRICCRGQPKSKPVASKKSKVKKQ